MPDLKPYTPPEIFEVPLRQEQAILTACDSARASASNSTTTNKCVSKGCKRAASGGGGNALPSS